MTPCFKFATSHKNMLPSMPTWLVNAFLIRVNPWKFGEKKRKLTKLFNICLNHVLFILFKRSYFQQKLNNFVNFEFYFTKLSGIDPYEKRINKVGMLDDRLVAMIYILASVHCSVASTFRVWKSRIHTYSKTIQCVNVCIWWKTDVVW